MGKSKLANRIKFSKLRRWEKFCKPPIVIMAKSAITVASFTLFLVAWINSSQSMLEYVSFILDFNPFLRKASRQLITYFLKAIPSDVPMFSHHRRPRSESQHCHSIQTIFDPQELLNLSSPGSHA